ncbi:MAG TPA: hypothetical protein VNL70_10720 [Tepidisphaeraceae bacterium]|jgi:hypothetical protein|nr:hypothetical protein [Tepidisphaeraceae bacterium]
MGHRDTHQSQPQPSASTPAGQVECRTLSLVKGKHHFCFRYEIGQEAKVLDALIELVNRRDVAFDWFDAAVLSHQLGQHLAKELKGFLPKKAA